MLDKVIIVGLGWLIGSKFFPFRVDSFACKKANRNSSKLSPL